MHLSDMVTYRMDFSAVAMHTALHRLQATCCQEIWLSWVMSSLVTATLTVLHILRSHDLQVRHKLGPEDINRITHKAAAAAEAALHQSLHIEDARDKSAAGASRFRSEAVL